MSSDRLRRLPVVLLLLLVVFLIGLLFPWGLLAPGVSGQILPVSLKAKDTPDFGVDARVFPIAQVNPDILNSIIQDDSTSQQQNIDRLETLTLALQQPIPTATSALKSGVSATPTPFTGSVMTSTSVVVQQPTAFPTQTPIPLSQTPIGTAALSATNTFIIPTETATGTPTLAPISTSTWTPTLVPPTPIPPVPTLPHPPQPTKEHKPKPTKKP